jgi:hypothetical protein
MTQNRPSSLYFKRLLGATFLPLGLSLLFVNVESSLASSYQSLPLSLGDAGSLPALAIPLFRLVQSYFFDHSGFLHSLSQILVSCWPITMILAGIVLLHGAFKSQLEAQSLAKESSKIGDLS